MASKVTAEVERAPPEEGDGCLGLPHTEGPPARRHPPDCACHNDCSPADGGGLRGENLLEGWKVERETLGARVAPIPTDTHPELD